MWGRGWMAALALALFGSRVEAAEPDATALAATVRESLAAWRVPGVAVAVVRPNRIVLLDGFGVRQEGTDPPVTPDTVFPLASCTKAFTTTLLAVLADEGKLSWDDPVRRHLPDFHLSDPLADRDVNLLDLVTHRTGLGSHDLLWYRASWNMDEMVHRAGKLPLSRPFRTGFEYQSVMVTAAGLAAARAGGAPWDVLVRSRLTDPLEMKSVAFTTAAALRNPDHAVGHRRDAMGKIAPVPWYVNPEPNPAGSVNASARDLSHWLMFQLGDGRWHDRRLVSTAGLEWTHTPVVVLPTGGEVAKLHAETTLMAYAPGWVVQDYRGHHLISHAGLIDGFRAHLTLLPKDGWGIAILANRHGTRLNLALSNKLVDRLLGLPPRDWDGAIGEVVRRDEAAQEAAWQRRGAAAGAEHPTGRAPHGTGRYIRGCGLRSGRSDSERWQTHLFVERLSSGTGTLPLRDVHPSRRRSRRPAADIHSGPRRQIGELPDGVRHHVRPGEIGGQPTNWKNNSSTSSWPCWRRRSASVPQAATRP